MRARIICKRGLQRIEIGWRPRTWLLGRYPSHKLGLFSENWMFFLEKAIIPFFQLGFFYPFMPSLTSPFISFLFLVAKRDLFQLTTIMLCTLFSAKRFMYQAFFQKAYSTRTKKHFSIQQFVQLNNSLLYNKYTKSNLKSISKKCFIPKS